MLPRKWFECYRDLLICKYSNFRVHALSMVFLWKLIRRDVDMNLHYTMILADKCGTYEINNTYYYFYFNISSIVLTTSTVLLIYNITNDWYNQKRLICSRVIMRTTAYLLKNQSTTCVFGIFGLLLWSKTIYKNKIMTYDYILLKIYSLKMNITLKCEEHLYVTE